MNKEFVFMAFAKGSESTEGNFKRYIGVAPVTVLAVNPNKKELESIYNREIDYDIEYLNTTTIEDAEVPQVRIDFLVKTSTKEEVIQRVTFYITRSARFNKDKTKVQIIDKYGRTAWATIDELKNKKIPVYKNGQEANIDKDFRAAYIGEENLTNFIKAYLNIPNVMKYINGTWVMTDNPEDCEARLEHIENYFKGDYSELKEIITFQPNNKVKVLFGIKATDEGKMRQVVYTDMFLKNNISNFDKLAKDVQDRQAAGAYKNTEFEVVPFKEYSITPTTFTAEMTATQVSDLPFDVNTSETNWFN